jgi:galactokinase
MKAHFFAPGRVNLIGEHLDYNGGLVMPIAIEKGIRLELIPRNDFIIKLSSTNDPLVVTIDLANPIENDIVQGWANYPLGIIAQYLKYGMKIKGMDLHYTSDLPMGSGLSSSAAIEVVTGYAMKFFWVDQVINRVALAKMAQLVENEFIDVKCGIMDQMAVSVCQKDHAILLDCNALTFEQIPFILNEYQLVILNTNVPRSLIYSAYNDRKRECEEALLIINSATGIDFPNLCSISSAELDKHKAAFENETIYRRAKHVITEQERTILAANALKNSDITQLAHLMTASHLSLKNDYEVTGFPLDTMVEEALNTKGCIGARMTGAGFGGCAIALVENEQVEKFKQVVLDNYFTKTGFSGTAFTTDTVDGVKREM